mmetsp:Transcript_6032/g.22818  ORF Transcript_6032/g.22818 Transcript_6032/m.22818 type:complete len:408 (-) Transcript_6032:1160-2383(-)
MKFPFASLSSDCINIVFSYHLEVISHDKRSSVTKNSRREWRHKKLRKRKREISGVVLREAFYGVKSSSQTTRSARIVPLTPSQLRFYSSHVSCFQFDSDVDVHSFFQSLVWKHRRQPIYFVDARNNDSLKDETLKYLRGIHTLDVRESRLVTDTGISHVRGVGDLNIAGCKLLTNKSFVHLQGISSLDMSNCDQDTISDEAFSYISGIRSLDMSYCNQESISDEAFKHLQSLSNLSMNHCSQTGITDRAFRALGNLQSLEMNFCSQTSISDKAFHSLKNIRSISMIACKQESITSNAFVHLTSLKSLDISFCNERTISEAALEHLGGLDELLMLGFKRSKWQDVLRKNVFKILKCDFKLHVEESVMTDSGKSMHIECRSQSLWRGLSSVRRRISNALGMRRFHQMTN